MMINELRDIYFRAQHVKSGGESYAQGIASLLKNGRLFWKTLKFLRESQWRSGEWHVEYQQRQLREIIKHALETTPFYMKYARKNGIDSESMKTLNSLRILPIISQSEIKSNLKDFISSNNNSKNNSTGSLKFDSHFDEYTAIMEQAFIARHWENAGFKLGSPSVYFVNKIRGFEREKFRHDKTSNRYYFAAKFLEWKNVSEYRSKIKEAKASFAFGYPSALEVFSDFILEWEIEMEFQGVITGGEILTNIVRAKIEKALNAKVYDLYRYTFPAVSMGQCCYCDGYHLFSENCFLELIDLNGDPVTEQGRVGRLIVTNFSNRTLPLIRFDTGDLGIYDGSPCDCGRGIPKVVRKIAGSQDELLIDAKGKYLSPGVLQATMSEAGFQTIKYQIIQKSRNKFKLKLVRNSEYSSEDLSKIKSILINQLGAGSEIEIESVASIHLEARRVKPIIREFNP